MIESALISEPLAATQEGPRGGDLESPAQPLLLCARQELVLALRSRWTQIFAVTFAALSLAVASSGYILSGGTGFQDYSRTTASLVQLVLLVVPLAAVVMGSLALSPERGASELLYSQPVARPTLLLGQLLGLFVALAAAQLLGFGAAGVVIFTRAGDEGLGSFLLLVGGSWLLTALFLGVAAALAAGTTESSRTRVLALALVIWFLSVIVYDLAALGLASMLRSGVASRLLIVAVLVNPVDAVRTAVMLGSEGTTAFGAASLAFLRFTHGSLGAGLWLAGSLAFWLAAPIGVALMRIRRCDL